MKTVPTESLSSSVRKYEQSERSLAALGKAIKSSGSISGLPPQQKPRASMRPAAPLAASSPMSLNTTFEPTAAPWRSYSTSVLVHAAIIAFLFIITFPLTEQLKRPTQRLVLFMPQLQAFKPKLVTPRIKPPTLVIKPIVKAAVIPPPVVKPREIKPQMMAAPVIKEMAAVRVPVPKIEAAAPAAPPPPKPEVRTGVFTNPERAKGATVPNQIKTGGFGDPNGARPNPQSSSPSMMAKLGGFDLPEGEAKGGAAGRGVVGQTSFGSLGDPNGVPGGTGHRGTVRSSGFGDGTGAGVAHVGQPGTVHASGFGDASAQSPSGTQRAAVAQPTSTPAEILFKPKPVYTQEARNLKLEGQVSLEVVFQASGTVRIVRVIRGLGHGLDEAAEQAAQQVRFRPATRGGAAVDTSATLYITFQLT